MAHRHLRTIESLRRGLAMAAAACLLAACAPAPPGSPILESAGTTGLLAVSATGSNNVRILQARDGGIALLRTVFLPPGERVVAIAWSSDAREAVITTSGGAIALDIRNGRVASVARLAAVSRRDPAVDRRR